MVNIAESQSDDNVIQSWTLKGLPSVSFASIKWINTFCSKFLLDTSCQSSTLDRWPWATVEVPLWCTWPRNNRTYAYKVDQAYLTSHDWYQTIQLPNGLRIHWWPRQKKNYMQLFLQSNTPCLIWRLKTTNGWKWTREYRNWWLVWKGSYPPILPFLSWGWVAKLKEGVAEGKEIKGAEL